MNAIHPALVNNPHASQGRSFSDMMSAVVAKVAKAALALFYFIGRCFTAVYQLLSKTVASRHFQSKPVDDMQLLRAALRSEKMTARHFIQLLEEFPHQKATIGKWICAWAKQRELKIDPHHPYYEIAQQAIRMKRELGGEGFSDDLSTYVVQNDGYWTGPPFPFIIYSIAGFMALTAPDNQELIRKLDTGTKESNPALRFCHALAHIFVYPNDQWQGAEKVYVASGALGQAWQIAKANDKIPAFFKTCFQPAFCFDQRIRDISSFIETFISDPDLTLVIQPGDTLERCVGEHYRVFRNHEVRRFCEDQRLDYRKFKPVIDRGEVNNAQTADFWARYCTRENFAAYLIQKGNPIKENGLPIPAERWGRILTPEFWA